MDNTDIKRSDLQNDSINLFNLLKSDQIDLAKSEFEEYEKKWINITSVSVFIKSIEEYLYNPFAREKGVTSLKIIEDNLESDILNKN